jgi:hypothetical protein
MSDLNEVLAGYVVCALWSTTDESTESGGYPLDENYEPSDIAHEAMRSMRADCADFLESNQEDLGLYVSSLDRCGMAIAYQQAGHDFWLTRNGHGAGFWDRGLGALGERLSSAARVYGAVDIYVGDDGKLYV